MSKQHFLVNTRAAGAPGGAALTPPERWLQAFPGGQWSNWATLAATVKAGDTVWVPVTYPDWAARVAELVRQQPDSAVVVVSGVPQDAEGLRAIDAGARGYCHLLAVPTLMQEVAQVVVGKGPAQVGFTADGRAAFVSLSQERAVAVIDPATRQVVRKVSVGEVPIQLYATPDSRTLLVANQGRARGQARPSA